MKGRHDAKIVQALATRICEALEDKRKIKTEICGSLRRGLSVVGDIDIVHNGVSIEIRDAIDKLFEGKVEIHSAGLKSMSFTVEGIQVDLYKSEESYWGATVLTRTGSMLFNILMRGRAKKLGYKLNEYGLWHNDINIASVTEDAIFMALGLQYVSPQDRNPSSHGGPKVLKELD